MKRFGFGKKDKGPPAPNPGFPPPQQQAANPYAAPAPNRAPPPQGGGGGYNSGGGGGGGGGGYGGGGGGYQGGGGGAGGGGYGAKREEDDDQNRSALFGNRGGKSPTPSATPSYASAAPSYASAAPSYSSGGYNSSGGGGGGYGGGSGGGGGGYGGYGGANRAPDNDPNRDKLFGDRPRPPPGAGPPGGGYGGGGGGYGGAAPGGGYGGGGYGDPKPREGLSPEEEEEEDVDAVKQQIRFTKQESVNSTRRALAVAAAAEETGRGTLTRLGQQGERLTNTKKNLDLASNQNRKAEETTRQLQTLNRSMFAVHVGNPFNSSKRAAAEEDKIVNRHQEEMAERERIRQAGFEGRKNINDGLGGQPGRGGYGGGGRGGYGSGMSGAERQKYQFEANESDDEKEKEIENNLDQIGSVVGRLRNLAVATNKEVDRQNTEIDATIKRVSHMFCEVYGLTGVGLLTWGALLGRTC